MTNCKFYRDWSNTYVCVFGESNVLHMYFSPLDQRWQYGGYWNPQWSQNLTLVFELEVIVACGTVCPKELGQQIYNCLTGQESVKG